MKDNRKCDQMKALRLPSFLVNNIEDSNNVPKCKTASDKYRFFLELGLQSFEEFQRVLSDPKYKRRANNELEEMFKDGMVVENLMSMEASKLKGLGMAVDLVRGKRRV
jgi:hypothetical protein